MVDREAIGLVLRNFVKTNGYDSLDLNLSVIQKGYSSEKQRLSKLCQNGSLQSKEDIDLAFGIMEIGIDFHLERAIASRLLSKLYDVGIKLDH
jgi:hypothetical protein